MHQYLQYLVELVSLSCLCDVLLSSLTSVETFNVSVSEKDIFSRKDEIVVKPENF